MNTDDIKRAENVVCSKPRLLNDKIGRAHV